MSQFPLLSLEQSIDIYKKMHSRNPAFGMDVFDENFLERDLLILENNGKGKSAPYTHCDYYILLLSLKGQSIRHINQYDYHIEAQTLQLLVPGAIHSFEDVSEEQKSYIILFDKNYFKNELQSVLELHKENCNPVNLQGCEFEQMKHLFEQIEFEYKNKQDEYKQVAKHLIAQALLLLKRKKLSSIQKSTISRSEQIMGQYLNLIEDSYQTKKTVAEYADILEITSKHLGETVKEVSKKPALFHINIRIMKEIKHLLAHTTLNINQISDVLNFDNSSNLGRFFKKYEGISPSKYRLIFINP